MHVTLGSQTTAHGSRFAHHGTCNNKSMILNKRLINNKRCYLNWFTVDQFTIASATLFHTFTILSVKYYFLISYLTFFLAINADDL